jgi:hypothetical protein
MAGIGQAGFSASVMGTLTTFDAGQTARAQTSSTFFERSSRCHAIPSPHGKRRTDFGGRRSGFGVRRTDFVKRRTTHGISQSGFHAGRLARMVFR